MFEKAYAFTMDWEGGYSNDPDDPGRETYKGISRRYHPDWEGWARIWYLTSEEMTWESDVVLEQLVREFYHRRYWMGMGATTMAQIISLVLFDTGVNCGRKRTKKWLQESANNLGARLKIDGIIGEKTTQAINERNHYRLVMGIVSRRLKNYTKSKNTKKYLVGWVNRVEDLLFMISTDYR